MNDDEVYELGGGTVDWDPQPAQCARCGHEGYDHGETSSTLLPYATESWPNCTVEGCECSEFTFTQPAQGDGGRWAVAGHNGLWVNPATAETGESARLRTERRVIYRETDEEYVEFEVTRRHASALADYLNALEERNRWLEAERDEMEKAAIDPFGMIEVAGYKWVRESRLDNAGAEWRMIRERAQAAEERNRELEARLVEEAQRGLRNGQARIAAEAEAARWRALAERLDTIGGLMAKELAKALYGAVLPSEWNTANEMPKEYHAIHADYEAMKESGNAAL